MTAPAVPVRVTWPVALDQAIRAELTGQVPLDVDAIVEQVRRDAYARGQLDAMRHVADEHARLDLLGANWVEQAKAEHLERRRQRDEADRERADAARIAANIAAGRHPLYHYRGGPVDYETGLPVGSACAWLRRRNRPERPAEPAPLPVAPIPGKPAYASWQDVHDNVGPGVWLRVWGDLSDKTRRAIQYLDPARPGRRLHAVGDAA